MNPKTLSGKAPANVIKCEKEPKDEWNDHPTVKPVKLLENLIHTFSIEGQTILDPFLGSGSTAVACQNLNRKCIGIETNPHYIEIAERRLDALCRPHDMEESFFG